MCGGNLAQRGQRKSEHGVDSRKRSRGVLAVVGFGGLQQGPKKKKKKRSTRLGVRQTTGRGGTIWQINITEEANLAGLLQEILGMSMLFE